MKTIILQIDHTQNKLPQNYLLPRYGQSDDQIDLDISYRSDPLHKLRIVHRWNLAREVVDGKLHDLADRNLDSEHAGTQLFHMAGESLGIPMSGLDSRNELHRMSGDGKSNACKEQEPCVESTLYWYALSHCN